MTEQTREQIVKEIRNAMVSFGDDFMIDIIDVYLSDAPARIAELRAAHTSGNAEVFTRAAHTLKSSSACVGAQHFSNLAKAIEMSSREGSMAGLTDQVARLETEFLQVKAALEEVRNGR
jgi:HPt (histidine-containing phosphotransfer) domain-containing protein